MKTDFIVSSLKETQEEDSIALKESEKKEQELCDGIAQDAYEIAKGSHDLKLIGNLIEVKNNKMLEAVYKSPVYTGVIGVMLIAVGFTSGAIIPGILTTAIGAATLGSSIAVNVELYPKITDEKRFFKRIETASKLLSQKESKLLTRKQAISEVLEDVRKEENKKQKELAALHQDQHEIETRTETAQTYIDTFESYAADGVMTEMPDDCDMVQELIGKRLIKKESPKK